MKAQRVLPVLIVMLMTISIIVYADFLVLKNGKKIYSKEPFNFTDRGVEFTLPSGMSIFISKEDIDFEATRKFNQRLKDSFKNQNNTSPQSKPEQKKTPQKPVEQVKPAKEIEKKEVSIPKPSTNSQTEQPKPQSKVSPPQLISKTETKPTDVIRKKSVEIKAKAKTQPVIQKPRKKKPRKKSAVLKKSPYNGIPIKSIASRNIPLEGLIELARKVIWDYQGKCPVCKGSGLSLLSTSGKKLVCTYCNGTGKGGRWNDDELMIGDDCPWCVLGYDELAKGPCKHCLGTGRYLGLDRLEHLLEIETEKDKKTNASSTNSRRK